MNTEFRIGFEKTALNTTRRKYREVDFGSLDPSLDDEIWSAKIDGAHGVMEFVKGELPRLYGHRISKRTNAPIEYTDKVRTLGVASPFDAVLRGEVYATRDGVVQGPNVMTSILNSSPEKSLQFQTDNNLETHVALFDVDSYKDQNHAETSPQDKDKLFREILGLYPSLTSVDTARNLSEKELLRSRVASGKHPQTDEGLVIYKGDKYIKAKLSKEHDVYIREIFMESTSTREALAGGFAYSWSPTGPIVGKVGTGFDFATKADMRDNPKKWVGKVAIVRALGVSPNNVLQKPSYQGLHVDKNIN